MQLSRMEHKKCSREPYSSAELHKLTTHCSSVRRHHIYALRAAKEAYFTPGIHSSLNGLQLIVEEIEELHDEFCLIDELSRKKKKQNVWFAEHECFLCSC